MANRPVKRNRVEVAPLPTRRLDTRPLPSFQDEPLSVDRAVGAVPGETRRLPATAAPRDTASRAQGLRKDGKPDGRIGRTPPNAGIIRDPGAAPARVITRDGAAPQVRYTDPGTGATRVQPMREPVALPLADISRADFVSALLDAIQTQGSRQAVADALHVDIRCVFRWQKGLGPNINKMPALYEKIQSLRAPTVYLR